jgi:flavocytochrome c
MHQSCSSPIARGRIVKGTKMTDNDAPVAAVDLNDSALQDAEPVDVLVIGGGMAGVTALLSAVESGARAALIEKTDHLGGSTIMSAGLLAFAGTDEQRAAGISDSVDSLRRDLLETGKHRNSVELVDTYCDNQLDTYHWLRDCGITFGHPDAGSGQTVPRSHPVDTTAAIEAISRRARDGGARIYRESPATRLLEAGDGVAGARVSVDGDELELRAGAVVLASGGFSRSPELLTRFAPAMEKALRVGGVGNTGDGLLMGCKVGAAIVDMPYIKGTFGIFPWPSIHEEGTGILAIYKGAIAVNGDGHRFVNESIPYKEIGDACLAQPEGIAYQVFDSKVLDAAEPAVAIYDFKRRVEVGHAQRADTPSALADVLGLPVDEFVATLERYNDRISSGEPDDFGRTTLSGGIGVPFALDDPPYFGFPSTTVMLATYCGLVINASAQVLDVFGEPIPGLFAAGELTGGLHGAGYVTGTSLGKSAIFGHIAGRSAARVALQGK